jgi:hypothetical protein
MTKYTIPPQLKPIEYLKLLFGALRSLCPNKTLAELATKHGHENISVVVDIAVALGFIYVKPYLSRDFSLNTDIRMSEKAWELNKLPIESPSWQDVEKDIQALIDSQ